MFELFGEFDSAEEINKAAEGQKNQGDKESLIALAKENGIDEMFAEAFLNGEIPCLVDKMTVAIGKLTVEVEAEKENSLIIDSMRAMADYLQSHCIDENLAICIRKKGKRLVEAVNEIRKEAEKKIINPPKRSDKGVEVVSVYMAPSTVYQMLRMYYER